MEARSLICDYSYHFQQFSNSHRGGLTTYLFRLQTEGSCEIYCNGIEHHVQAGDLLLLKPGDEYEPRVKEDGEDGRVSSGDYFIFCDGSWIDDWWNRIPALSSVTWGSTIICWVCGDKCRWRSGAALKGKSGN